MKTKLEGIQERRDTMLKIVREIKNRKKESEVKFLKILQIDRIDRQN